MPPFVASAVVAASLLSLLSLSAAFDERHVLGTLPGLWASESERQESPEDRRVQRNQTGTGQCPSDCCCDFEFTQVGQKRKISAVNSCTIHSFLDKNGKLLRLEVHPYSPVATGNASACAEKTSDFCGPIIPPEGCSFQPSLPGFKKDNANAQEPSPEPTEEEEPAVSQSSGASKDTPKAGTTTGNGNRKRNVILLSTTLSLLGLALAGSLLYFIVIPALRGMTNQSEAAESDENDESVVESFSSVGGGGDSQIQINFNP